MIDFSAIEAEIMTVVTALDKFQSTSAGRIRMEVALPQMPSVDISATGHKFNPVDDEAEYHIPILCVIRRAGVDREDNANAFKVLIESICTALESRLGTAYRVVREMDSDLQEYDAGSGKMVRAGVLTFTALA